MDEPKQCYAKRNKSDRERQVPYNFTHMWNPRSKINKESTNSLGDTENRLTAASREEGGELGEKGEGMEGPRLVVTEQSWECEVRPAQGVESAAPSSLRKRHGECFCVSTQKRYSENALCGAFTCRAGSVFTPALPETRRKCVYTSTARDARVLRSLLYKSSRERGWDEAFK